MYSNILTEFYLDIIRRFIVQIDDMVEDNRILKTCVKEMEKSNVEQKRIIVKLQEENLRLSKALASYKV